MSKGTKAKADLPLIVEAESEYHRPKERRVSTKAQDMVRDPGVYYIESPGNNGVISSTQIGRDMKMHIQHIVQSGRFPFDSESKLVRSAVYYFVERVIGPKMESRFRTDLKLIAAQRRMQAVTARLSEIKKFVRDTAEAMNTLHANDQIGEIRKLWYDVNVLMLNMDEPYRSLYRNAFAGNGCTEWNTVKGELGLTLMKPGEMPPILKEERRKQEDYS